MANTKKKSEAAAGAQVVGPDVADVVDELAGTEQIPVHPANLEENVPTDPGEQPQARGAFANRGGSSGPLDAAHDPQAAEWNRDKLDGRVDGGHLDGCPADKNRIESYEAVKPSGDKVKVTRCVECGATL